MTLSVPVGNQILGDVVLRPNPFTPNGDGINDELAIDFSVFHVSQTRQAHVRIYELSGRQIWTGGVRVVGGAQQIRWNGTDMTGQIVPPGLYICQSDLGADSHQAESTTLSQVVAVAY